MSATTKQLSPAALSERVRIMLACLFGPRTKVRPLPQLPASGDFYFAGYVNSVGEENSFLVCDSNFAVASGAALTLIPPSTAAEIVAKGSLPDSIYDNFKEVLNVCVGFYTETTNDRIRLSRVEHLRSLDQQSLPETNSEFTCEVSIETYPKGIAQFRWKQ